MRILSDHNVPLPLRDSIQASTVETTAERGWERLTNGELLDAAEREGFEIPLTSDEGFLHQQNLSRQRIAVVLLNRGNWPDVRTCIPSVLNAISAAKGGTCTLVAIP